MVDLSLENPRKMCSSTSIEIFPELENRKITAKITRRKVYQRPAIPIHDEIKVLRQEL